jgi:DNA-binding GntR family transcriptional regulator
VVQALKWLEFQNLVEHIPNRGYYSSPFSLQEVRENFEVRELIELSLLPACIQNLDQKGIHQLEASHEAHINAEKGKFLNEKLIKDRDFHLALAAQSKTQVQVQVLGWLFDTIYLKYRGGYFSTTSRHQTIDEHQKILHFVVSRDLKNARKAVKEHLTRAQKQVLQNLETITADRNISGI